MNPFDSSRHNRWWTTSQISAQSHAHAMASMAASPFREMIMDETAAFCMLPPPDSDLANRERVRQRMALSTKIGAISHASTMVGLHPSIAGDVIRLAREFCAEVPLDDQVHQRSSTFRSMIMTLSHAATLKSLAASFG